MEKYFVTLSQNGTIEIPKPLIEKLCWYENTTLFQFTRCGEIFVTDHEPEDIDNAPHESNLGEADELNISKELLDELGIGLDESLAVFMFYDGIIGIAKDLRECAICGKTNELAAIESKYICYDCTLAISGIEDNMFK